MDPFITGVAISLVSYHLHRQPDLTYNGINPGIFVEVKEHALVGVYRNTLDRTTVLVAAQSPYLEIGGLKLGGVLGVCSGYDRIVCGAGIVRAGPVNLMLVPPVGQHAAVVALAIRKDLK